MKSIFLLLLLLLPIIHAQQLPEGANWSRLYGDAFGSNFSPQTSITKDTATPLDVKWIFPLFKNPDIDAIRVAEGVEHPPLVIDGILYFVKGSEQIVALNAEDGRFIWGFRPSFNPKGRAIATGLIHTHGIEVIDGTLYHLSKDCAVYGLDALTGQVKLAIGDMCDKSEGSEGYYSSSYPPTVYRKKGILIAAPAGSAYGARGFVIGYDLKTGQELWRWYVVPPAGYQGNWAAEAAGRGNLVASEDWGRSNLIGGGGVWSRFSVDEESGIVYFGTGNPAPVFNATNRPGPNLFTNSIIALNANDGSLVWYYQTTPHDTSDYDCGWNTILAKVRINGVEKKVVIQGCKNGYLYAIDAFTGKPVWEPLNLPDVARLNDKNANAGNAADIRTVYSADKSKWDSSGSFTLCPGHTGAIETPNSFAYNTIFVAIKNECVRIRPEPVSIRPPQNQTFAGSAQITMAPAAINTTVYAVDASTGKIKWRHFIDNTVISGGCCMVSGGVVYFGDRDGRLYALDADNGALLWERRFNAIFSSPPSIGASLNGDMMLFVPVSGGPAAEIPGAIIALGLPSQEQVTVNGYLTLVLLLIAVAAIATAIVQNIIYKKRKSIAE
ncbi:MAG: hypothetical protein FJ358_02815 [Thaumarchaeota archaeon]|nr:hypothetical protein [Nitrososphaerota archaeon]